MDLTGVPILDYTPETLVGLAIVAIFFGWLVPYRVVKQLEARISYLESANTKLADALAEEQETSKVVRHFFDGLGRGA